MDRPRLIRVLVTASTTRVDRISYIGAVVVADSSGNAIMAWRTANDVAIRCFDASTRMWSARVEIDTDAPGQLEVAIAEDGSALVGLLAPGGLWAFSVE